MTCSIPSAPCMQVGSLKGCCVSVLCRAKVQGGDSNEALKDNARGILLWKVFARSLQHSFCETLDVKTLYKQHGSS